MAPTPAKQPDRQPATQQEVVDPRWLLKALGLTFAAAAALSYLTLCLLIYQGGWQLMLHPSPKIDVTPHVGYQAIRFDAAETGTPRLTGWWIPAESPSTRTILFLHDGSGSLSTAVPKLDLLHTANVNIFAIDYRGFGQSDPPRPTEARMAEDAAAALDYLTNTRHISPAQIIPCGEGLGAVLAANLAHAHTELPAIILDNPDPNAFTLATTGGKSALLPMHILVRERFDIAAAVTGLKTPKLLLEDDSDAARVAAERTLFQTAADPKMSVTLSSQYPHYPALNNSKRDYVQSIVRFLDEYAQ